MFIKPNNHRSNRPLANLLSNPRRLPNLRRRKPPPVLTRSQRTVWAKPHLRLQSGALLTLKAKGYRFNSSGHEREDNSAEDTVRIVTTNRTCSAKGTAVEAEAIKADRITPKRVTLISMEAEDAPTKIAPGKAKDIKEAVETSTTREVSSRLSQTACFRKTSSLADSLPRCLPSNPRCCLILPICSRWTTLNCNL
jgi:hypothetical protein